MIKEAWDEFDERVLPLECGQVQRIETKRAFYQGAIAMFFGIVNMLEPGKEVADGDIIKMDAIKAEVDQFAQDLRDGNV